MGAISALLHNVKNIVFIESFKVGIGEEAITIFNLQIILSLLTPQDVRRL